jgi:hypothetical protein
MSSHSAIFSKAIPGKRREDRQSRCTRPLIRHGWIGEKPSYNPILTDRLVDNVGKSASTLSVDFDNHGPVHVFFVRANVSLCQAPVMSL